MEYSVDVLFNEWSNYKSEEFDLKDKVRINNFLKLLNGNNVNITTKCIECGREYAFMMEHQKEYFDLQRASDGRMQLFHGNKYVRIEFEDYETYNLEYLFKCTKNKEHIYTMYITVIQRRNIFEVVKTGQYPNKEDIQGFDFDEYKKVLEKYDIYKDYKNAYVCNCHNFSVASYAYIRRVFEKILVSFIEVKKEKTGKEPKDNKVENKIKFTSDMFCDDIRPLLTMLYSVLSKGVHQLSEEECKKYYDTLHAIIKMQLADMEAERQKEEKKKSLSKELSKIHSELSKK